MKKYGNGIMKYIVTLVTVACVFLHTSSQVSMAQTDIAPKQTAIQFSHDRVIELAFTSFNIEKIDQVVNEYFPKVMPIVFEYGGRPLMGLQTISVPAGDMQPQRVGFFEWPSVEAFRKIVQDPRVLKIIEIRNDALTYINESNFFTVADNVKITFDSARVYLFMAVWMKPGAENAINEHFQDIDSQMQAGGGTVLLELLPLAVPDGEYHPHGVRVYEWATVKAVEAFFQKHEYQQIIADAAVEKIDIILSKVVFFE